LSLISPLVENIMMLAQRTIAKKVEVVGVGIHSGMRVKLTLNPAPEDFGICFQRTDIKNAEMIKAHSSQVSATENNTTLGSQRNVIHTVEHLLSVIYSYGIDNLLIEIDGPEVPIMDGSGAAYVFLIKEAGLTFQSSPKKFLVITDTIRVTYQDKWAEISPADSLIIDSTIVFPHALIKEQRRVFDFNTENFINEISRARTFALMKDVDSLKRKGLIRGGSLDNAVVLDDYKVVNHDGLRFNDEFVRHKILDTIGDIALLGHPVLGKITTYKSGHNVHNLLCQKLLSTPGTFEVTSYSSLSGIAISSYELPKFLSPVYV